MSSLIPNTGLRITSSIRTVASSRGVIPILSAPWKHLIPWWPVFALSLIWPLLASLCVVWASGPGLGWFVGRDAWTGKEFQECLGPCVLLLVVGVASYGWCLVPVRFRAWWICWAVLLLCREIHFAGTGAGVYVGLVALLVWLIRDAAISRPLLRSPLTASCLLGTLGWYFIAKSVDDGLWKWLPHAHWWSVNVEETLETGGHLSLLITILISTAVGDGLRWPAAAVPSNTAAESPDPPV